MGIRDDVGRLTRRSAKGDHTREAAHHRPTEVDQARDVARYRYLLRVASRERLELAHQVAFSAQGPEQRERLFRRLCHDLSEEDRPTSSEPAELAHAAVGANEVDQGYLVRMLRRPGHGVTEGHSILEPSQLSGHSLFAESMLATVAAAVGTSAAVSSLLPGFDLSPEASQVEASLFVRPPEDPTGHAAWQAGIIPGGGAG